MSAGPDLSVFDRYSILDDVVPFLSRHGHPTRDPDARMIDYPQTIRPARGDSRSMTACCSTELRAAPTRSSLSADPRQGSGPVRRHACRTDECARLALAFPRYLEVPPAEGPLADAQAQKAVRVGESVNHARWSCARERPLPGTIHSYNPCRIKTLDQVAAGRPARLARNYPEAGCRRRGPSSRMIT